MGVPTSEVGYTSATAGRGDHEVYNRHVVALENNICAGTNKNFPKCEYMIDFVWYRFVCIALLLIITVKAEGKTRLQGICLCNKQGKNKA
jgi:hypothetical protein